MQDRDTSPFTGSSVEDQGNEGLSVSVISLWMHNSIARFNICLFKDWFHVFPIHLEIQCC